MESCRAAAQQHAAIIFGFGDSAQLDKMLRRYENTLVILGTGVIMYGLWSVAKTVFLLLQEARNLRASGALSLAGAQLQGGPEMARLVTVSGWVVFWVIAVVMIGIDIALRLYVGLSARAEGFGTKKRGSGYLVVAGLMAVLSFATAVYTILHIPSGLNDLENNIVTMIVEVTSVIILVEMIRAAWKVKKLRKEKQLRNAESAKAEGTEKTGQAGTAITAGATDTAVTAESTIIADITEVIGH